MIPISDANPTRRLPVMNWALIALNVAVFLYEVSLPAPRLDQLIATWGMTSTRTLLALANPAHAPIAVWETLITSQFLHAGWAHILGNMLFLWVFGDNIEDVLGHFAYLLFYLLSGIAAGIAQAVVLGPSPVPSIGASGAIAGVLGAYLLLYPWARIGILVPLFIIFWTFDVPAVFVIGWWFIQQFLYGIATLTETAASGIAFWAHIGGFITGVILILPFIGRAHRSPRPSVYSN
ncbi:MAG: rhomboid family intramembrane serine protease [Chloroflexota bacterium]|nr:rhomboid family intramembrane serine protease [Chloroflexota bacterium]